MVSGDYYDFIQLNSTTIAIAAPIFRQGISAALLMASLQGRASQSTARAGQRHAKHCGTCFAFE